MAFGSSAFADDSASATAASTSDASTDSSSDSAASSSSTQADSTKKATVEKIPIWFSLASSGSNQSLGFLGRRLGDQKKEAIEIAAIFAGDNTGYGLDYLRFFDISQSSSWFLGIGAYSVLTYNDSRTEVISNKKIALSVGYQKVFNQKYLIGIGLNTIRGISFQLGLGI